MKSTRMKMKIIVPVLFAMFILSACTVKQQNPQIKSAEITSKTGHVHDGKTNSDISVIPSYDGMKVKTTNQYGTSFSGMGTSVYSRIGSSSLLSSGISTQLESMLSNVGISGIKVLVLGDLVVLGESGPHTNGESYHPLQNKLLSPNTGSSGKGYQSSTGTGTGTGSTVESKGAKKNNLERAQSEIQSIFGGNIRIFTVNSTDNLNAMDRVKSALNSGSATDKLDHDISTILKKASEQNIK